MSTSATTAAVAHFCLALVICGCTSSAKSTTYEVASSSMAPVLSGPTRQASCDNCGYVFEVAAETFRENIPTRCSRCGGLCSVASETLPGERVAVQQLSDTDSLHRFDLIVFHESGAAHVKRIWGMPDEEVVFRDGELWLDGHLYHKSLQELRQLCVPVDSLSPKPSRNWQLSTGEVLSSALVRVAPGGWLEWHYHRPAAVHPAEVPEAQWLQPSLLVDDYLANQGVATQLHIVDDYLVSMQFEQSLHGIVTIECKSRNAVVKMNLSAAQAVRKSSAGLGQRNSVGVHCSRKMEFAFCDGRLLISTDRQAQAWDWPTLIEQGSASELSLPAEASQSSWLIRISSTAEERLAQVEIARDLFLTDPATTAAVQSAFASTAGYFVVGDNLPVSVDSRNGFGRVKTSQIIGRVRSKVDIAH